MLNFTNAMLAATYLAGCAALFTSRNRLLRTSGLFVSVGVVTFQFFRG